MKNWWNKNLWWCLFLLVVIIYFWPYYRLGLPVTHDGENHVARFAQYYLAFKQGQIIPRLAPSLQNGFGYPVFNFNYPLANILSLPLSMAKIHYELSFKLIVVFFYLMGGLGVWQWLKKIIPELKKPVIPLLSFWLAPYLFQAIFYRGNIGEAMSFCLVPLILWQIERKRENSKGSSWLLLVLLASFFLSHNIMVLLLTPLLFCYAWWRLKTKNTKINFLMTVLVAIGLTLWFWLPALGEKSLIVLDGAGVNQEFAKHFIDWQQLFKLNLSRGFSEVGMVDGLGYGLGLVFVMGWLINLMLLTEKKYFYNHKINIILVIISILLIFIQTSGSQWWWKNIPFLNYVQFPWRWSLLLNLCLVWQLALIKNNHKGQKVFWACLFLIQGLLMINAWPKEFFTKTRDDYWSYPQTTTILGENRPKSFTYEITKGHSGQPLILVGEGEIKQIEKNNNTIKKYQLDCQASKCLIVEETAYFIGYETKINGELINYVDGKEINGRIAFEVSRGNYQIVTKFTQKTWARLLGNGLLILSLMILFWRRKKINHNQW